MEKRHAAKAGSLFEKGGWLPGKESSLLAPLFAAQML